MNILCRRYRTRTDGFQIMRLARCRCVNLQSLYFILQRTQYFKVNLSLDFGLLLTHLWAFSINNVVDSLEKTCKTQKNKVNKTKARLNNSFRNSAGIEPASDPIARDTLTN